jgi:hypothetical protein
MPSLIHCAHGKDRTGVVIMLLLLICDTPHEAIVQDYIQVNGSGGCAAADLWAPLSAHSCFSPAWCLIQSDSVHC